MEKSKLRGFPKAFVRTSWKPSRLKAPAESLFNLKKTAVAFESFRRKNVKNKFVIICRKMTNEFVSLLMEKKRSFDLIEFVQSHLSPKV